ncbi:unnamed protein product [Adineta steineri]|uniref:LysM domain-containing protein n=1 Tax=Adineta steineri TaxID=433720 RepID=A0A819QUC8_9BILA|nr:unnamed protein product [Adineta steineri]CAF4036591.1 unnamed protein product [Adineta steineri]
MIYPMLNGIWIYRIDNIVSAPQRRYYRGMFSGSRAWFEHTVTPVDTTGDIARYYGAKLQQTIEANPGIQPDVIVDGQKIQVPVSLIQAFWFLSGYQRKGGVDA